MYEYVGPTTLQNLPSLAGDNIFDLILHALLLQSAMIIKPTQFPQLNSKQRMRVNWLQKTTCAPKNNQKVAPLSEFGIEQIAKIQ